MALLSRRPPPGAAQDPPVPDDNSPTEAEGAAAAGRRWRRPRRPAPAVEWTFGATLATRAVHAALVACLAAGPLALVVAAVGGSASAPASSTGAADTAPATVREEARASAAAQRLVVSWLTASRADAPALARQLLDPSALPRLELPKARPPGPSRTWTEDAVRVAAGRWQVTIGAQGPTGGYFAVPVHVDETGAAAVALPARTTAPSTPTRAVAPANWQALPATDAAAVTVTGYLAALLTGTGDLDRWTTPGSGQFPVTPSPCRRVDVQAVASVADALPDLTLDGAQTAVIATAACTSSRGPGGVSQYPLLLTARAGRWEVAGANPTLNAPVPNPPGQPSTTSGAPPVPTPIPTPR